jgi:pimeloyl-ACP methyl ester carboxylesterase
MGHRAFLCCTAIAIAFSGIACGRDGDSVVKPRDETIGSIAWKACDKVQCGSLDVPLDRGAPDGKKITLALVRQAAVGTRKGVLIVNPGGPGASGVAYLQGFGPSLPKEIRRSFDIVSFDPRGVGNSAPVRCLDDLDAFYAVDRSPDTPAEIDANVRVAKEFAAACRRESGELLPHVSSDATVHDIDAIRAALGEEQVSFLGFSYGTYLGARYADLFPNRVRAMVLDGAIDPTLSYRDTAIQQAQGFERNLNAFLEYCRTDGCGFAEGGDPAQAFALLSEAVDAEPQYAHIDGEERILGPGEFDIGVVSALYTGRGSWDQLGGALAEAGRGTGETLLRYSDQYTQRKKKGEYSNITAALYAIGCLDSLSPPSLQAVQQLAVDASKAAPHLGAATAWLGLPCTYWPVRARAIEPLGIEGAPPIVVVGTLRDPATPYAWAESLSRQLPGSRLLSVDSDTHTSYARGNECVNAAVHGYLVDLELPAEGLRCA